MRRALGRSGIEVSAFVYASGLLGSTLIISIPFSIVQWIAWRKIFPVSNLWILAMPVALLVAVLILREIPDGLWQIVDDESPLALTAGYLLIGLIIAIPQWLLLRREFSNSSIGLLSTSIGVASGSGLVLVTNLINQSPIIAYLVAVLAYAVVTGLTLSRLIINQDQSQSGLASAT
jgi:hypothetical protein